jgi:hypothetical protein
MGNVRVSSAEGTLPASHRLWRIVRRRQLHHLQSVFCDRLGTTCRIKPIDRVIAHESIGVAPQGRFGPARYVLQWVHRLEPTRGLIVLARPQVESFESFWYFMSFEIVV